MGKWGRRRRREEGGGGGGTEDVVSEVEEEGRVGSGRVEDACADDGS